jgi:hypothetical protein
LWLPGNIFKDPFYFVESYSDAHPATILLAGPNGKYARSWWKGCLELEPIFGGLFINIVWIDFMLFPQKLFKYGIISGLEQKLCNSSSYWKSWILVIDA